MFALDLFNNDHERRLNEGAVDNLEQRRIDDLAMKMDDLVARARTATTPEVKAALIKEFQKCKAERDSYYHVKDEGMFSPLGEETHEFKGAHGKLDVERTPGKTVVRRKEYPGADDTRTDKFPNSRLRGKGSTSQGSSGSSSLNTTPSGAYRKMPRLDHDANDISNYEVDEAGIPGNVPADKIPGKEDLLKGRGRSYYEDQQKNAEVTDPAQDRLLTKARREFPKARSDAEALAMKILGKEQDDVDRLDRVNDREDRMIDRLSNLEQNLQHQIDQLKTSAELDEGRMGEIDAMRQDLERMNDRQFYTAYGISKAAFQQKYRALLKPALDEHGGGIGPKQHWQDLMQENKLAVGDPIVVTGPNEFEGKTGEIDEFAPSGTFVIVNLYNHGKHSMHLSDIAYNEYADQEQDEEDDWYDDQEDTMEGFQDFNKVEPYAVCLAGKPVKKFDYYEQARKFHDNWKQKLYREGDKAKADTITLMPLNLDEAMNVNDLLSKATKDANKDFKKAKSGKLKASGDFTKGDHWQGAKPGDYGYTGYQGHGMPKDNPKKKKGVAEGENQEYTVRVVDEEGSGYTVKVTATSEQGALHKAIVRVRNSGARPEHARIIRQGVAEGGYDDPKIQFLQPTIQFAEKMGYRVTLNPQGRVVAKLVNKQLGHIVHIGLMQPSGKGFEVSMADNLDKQTNAWSAKELAQDFKGWYAQAVKDQDFNNGYNEKPQLEQQGVAEGFGKLTPQQKAHEYNLDSAQREMDRRHAEGEDMTGAKIDKKTYKIVKPKQQGVAESENNDTAISLSKLGKFHPGADSLAEFVPERATAQYALHPDKWESTFYSLTNKDSDKLKYYGPKKISIPPGTLVGDMAIANKFYRAKTPEEKQQYAELYKASLQPYPVDVSAYRMPELLIPRQGVAEGDDLTHAGQDVMVWTGPPTNNPPRDDKKYWIRGKLDSTEMHNGSMRANVMTAKGMYNPELSRVFKAEQGVAEDVSRLSDAEYNRVAAYVRKKYPGTQLSGLGRNPDGSFNVMIDTGSGRHEFKVRFRDPEETDIDEAETDYSKRRQRERDIDAGKPVAKQRQSKMTDYQKKRAQDKKDMALGEDQDTSGVESAIIRRIMIAHTDLLKQFGPEKVMQATEEVAYNVGDVDEIGTSDVSAYVAQVRQILGA